MSPNKQTIPDDEIDLREIILKLWKEKYLILIITLVFTVAGYIYGTLKPKAYQATITLREAPVSIFKKYERFFSSQQQPPPPPLPQISLALNYNQNFMSNLLSLDNLVKFVDQNKKIDEFKSYLKTKNIKTRAYFNGKFQYFDGKKNKLQNQYALNFSSPLPGPEFLNDYIIYTKKVTVDEFKKELIESVRIEIEIYDQNLETALSINLENPILKSFAEGNSVVNEPSALFYKGSKVLSQQKLYLMTLLKEIDNFTLNYNPILEQSSNTTLKTVTYSPGILMAIAFALGLFFSFIFIYIRSMFAR